MFPNKSRLTHRRLVRSCWSAIGGIEFASSFMQTGETLSRQQSQKDAEEHWQMKLCCILRSGSSSYKQNWSMEGLDGRGFIQWINSLPPSSALVKGIPEIISSLRRENGKPNPKYGVKQLKASSLMRGKYLISSPITFHCRTSAIRV